jgi:hypothetical protein
VFHARKSDVVVRDRDLNASFVVGPIRLVLQYLKRSAVPAIQSVPHCKHGSFYVCVCVVMVVGGGGGLDEHRRVAGGCGGRRDH